ncbi:MAG: acyltransferase family protein [Dehalococcoidia bacterium]
MAGIRQGPQLRHATAYLPAVDGLRALAIAAVFVFHADTEWLPGGFLGVDLFFAISGFLITRGLLHEYDLRGGIDLRRFWVRRARRLLPAAVVFIFLLSTAALAFFPGDVRALRGVAVSALGYVTNWYLIFSQQPYFETVGRPQMLQHLWSLAVEEQFYLIWPPVLLVALRFLPRMVVLGGTVFLGLASAALMAWMYGEGESVSRLYYGTDTHAVGLLLGAALAFGEPAWERATGRAFGVSMQAAGFAALAGVGFLFLWLGEARPFLYQGGFVVTALLSLVLIAAATVPGPLARVGGSAPLRWFGVRSYSMYLWHPPLIALLMGTGLELPAPVLALLAAAATTLVADLSYRYVETPIRNGSIRRAFEEFGGLGADTRWVLTTGMSIAVSFVVLATAVAPAPVAPEYLAVGKITGVLTAETPLGATVVAPSWVVPRDLLGGSSAEPVSRSIIPVRTPTAGLTVRSMNGVVTPTPAPVQAVVPAPTEAPPDDPVFAASATPAAAPATATATAVATAAPPAPPVAPAGPAQVFALGDSVMLGAANGLANAFGKIEVDAAIGRDVASALRILRERRADGRLPATVIVQLGNNGPITRPQMDELMQVLREVPRVIVVDLHVPQPWEGPNNVMLADAVAKWPNARLVAWHSAASSSTNLFWDNLHLRPEGVALYVNLIAEQAR